MSSLNIISEVGVSTQTSDNNLQLIGFLTDYAKEGAERINYKFYHHSIIEYNFDGIWTLSFLLYKNIINNVLIKFKITRVLID